MKVLTLSNDDIQKALPYKKLIPCMVKAMSDYSKKSINCPPRNVLSLIDKKALGYMPCFIEETKSLGVKITAVFPENKSKMIQVHQGVVILFNYATGQPEAFLNASEITARRTAAMSAAATDLLANPDAKSLAIFGYGTQAKEHIKALREVREIDRLNIYSRSDINDEKFIIETHFYKDVRSALKNSEIICLCTSATSPYLSSKDILPGTHINAIGACRPDQQEISIDSESDLSIYVDSKESTFLEASEIKLINTKQIKGEVGEAFTKAIVGRENKNEITLYKSVGLAIQDIYSAMLAVSEAQKMGLGKEIVF